MKPSKLISPSNNNATKTTEKSQTTTLDIKSVFSEKRDSSKGEIELIEKKNEIDNFSSKGVESDDRKFDANANANRQFNSERTGVEEPKSEATLDQKEKEHYANRMQEIVDRNRDRDKTFCARMGASIEKFKAEISLRLNQNAPYGLRTYPNIEDIEHEVGKKSRQDNLFSNYIGANIEKIEAGGSLSNRSSFAGESDPFESDSDIPEPTRYQERKAHHANRMKEMTDIKKSQDDQFYEKMDTCIEKLQSGIHSGHHENALFYENIRDIKAEVDRKVYEDTLFNLHMNTTIRNIKAGGLS